uniref:Uncharacterized protein n=1 Tax=Oryza glaberrima TaxID=4538 RepID=I1QLG6_ORYGL
PRRPRASLPRSLLPASSQERLPTAAAPPRPRRSSRARPPRSLLLLPAPAATPRPSRSRRGRSPSSPPPRPAGGATPRPRRRRGQIVLLPLRSAAGADFGPFSAAGIIDLDLSPRPSFFPTAAAVLHTAFSSAPLPALRRVLAGAAAVSCFSHSDQP